MGKLCELVCGNVRKCGNAALSLCVCGKKGGSLSLSLSLSPENFKNCEVKLVCVSVVRATGWHPCTRPIARPCMPAPAYREASAGNAVFVTEKPTTWIPKKSRCRTKSLRECKKG